MKRPKLLQLGYAQISSICGKQVAVRISDWANYLVGIRERKEAALFPRIP